MSNEKQPSPFPSSWAKRGFVYVHPKDHRVYPKEFFELDPNDFVVPPSGEKRIENWGLENSRFNTNGGKVDWTEYTNLYNPHPTPYDQYIGALAKRKMEQVASPEVQDACKTTLKVRIMLEYNENECWREFLIPACVSLESLHDRVISAVMGWSRGYHGHVFLDHRDGAVLGPKKYGEYIDVMMWSTQNYNAYIEGRQFPIASILRNVGDTCGYVYDLGDKWSHILRVEQVLQKGEKGFATIDILHGYGGCPPEDSFGTQIHGSYEYPQFLERYKKASPQAQKQMEAECCKAENYRHDCCPHRYHPYKYDLAMQRRHLYANLNGPAFLRTCAYGFFGDPIAEDDSHCAACQSRLKPLMWCAKCKTVAYCCRDCQVKDWKRHKKACKVPVSAEKVV